VNAEYSEITKEEEQSQSQILARQSSKPKFKQKCPLSHQLRSRGMADHKQKNANSVAIFQLDSAALTVILPERPYVLSGGNYHHLQGAPLVLPALYAHDSQRSAKYSGGLGLQIFINEKWVERGIAVIPDWCV
jgi:hypothetical protein